MGTGSAAGRVAVGIDGSPHSVTALAWAIEEARLRGLALRVIYAFPALVSYASGTTAHEYYPQVEKQAHEVFDHVLAEAPDHSGVPVERAVLPGNPAMVLLEASRDASLLVIGSRGVGGFRGMLLGSVSSHLVHHAHCPVLVVRDAAGVPPRASA